MWYVAATGAVYQVKKSCALGLGRVLLVAAAVHDCSGPGCLATSFDC